MTTRAFTATATNLILDVPVGGVLITTDPTATEVSVTVTTADESGQYAQAVEQTRLTEQDGTVLVSVPVVHPEPVRIGNSTFHRGLGNARVYNHVSNVQMGPGGIQVDGDLIGVIANNSIVTGDGHELRVEISMPTEGRVLANMSTGALQVDGHLFSLNATVLSGSVRVESVENVRAIVDNGSVRIGRVGETLSTAVTNGSVRIDEYAGREGRVTTTNGSITLTATPAASRYLVLKTTVGTITTTGAQHLQVHASTEVGRVSHR